VVDEVLGVGSVPVSVSSQPDSWERPHALTNSTTPAHNFDTLGLATARAWHGRGGVAGEKNLTCELGQGRRESWLA